MILVLNFIFFLFMTDEPRQVLLFYKEGEDQQWKKQLSEFEKNAAGMKERDIVVKSYKFSPANSAQFKKWDIKESSPFTFILIGRDGGEKYRSEKYVSHEELFGKIDAMPMRRSEIKKNR